MLFPGGVHGIREGQVGIGKGAEDTGGRLGDFPGGGEKLLFGL